MLLLVLIIGELMSLLGQIAGVRHAIFRGAAWTPWLCVHLPVRVQKSMLHFGGTAASLLGKHSSLSRLLNICLFLLFCSGLDFIDCIQNAPKNSILFFGLPSRTRWGDV